ncbi:hypothetical protein Dimus_032552 [Dionaea muscipula]
MLSMLGNYILLDSNGSNTTNVFFSVFSFDSCDEVYIQTPLPLCKFSHYFTKGECLLRPCPDHEATCTLIFAPPSREMEIWVLKGYGALGSWTKQISVGFEGHALSGLSCNGKKTTLPLSHTVWPFVHFRQLFCNVKKTTINYRSPISSHIFWPFVHYRQSLVSIPQVLVNQDSCIESNPSFCIDETYPSGRTLFTF